MGGIVRKQEVRPEEETALEEKQMENFQCDVIDAANLALSVQKDDYSTNIELVVSMEGLKRRSLVTSYYWFIQVSRVTPDGLMRQVVGRTEINQNANNPSPTFL